MNTDERGLRAWAVGAVLMVAVGLPTMAATPVPSGKWSFVFTDARGQADRPLRVYTYRPRQCDSTCPMVFVMHGTDRKASAMIGRHEFPVQRMSTFLVSFDMLFNTLLYAPKASD